MICQICKKRTAMKKIEKDYAAFERLMNEKKIYLDRNLQFEGICSIIGAGPAELDRLIIDELGHTGQSVLDLYRSQEEQERIPE